MAAPTPGATSYSLISASDAVAVGNVVDANFDCADVSALDTALIKGKILVCSWNDLSFTGPTAANLSYTAAVTSGAVGVVLLTTVRYAETLSPSYWNFQDFPAIVITGPTSYQVINLLVSGSMFGLCQPLYDVLLTLI